MTEYQVKELAHRVCWKYKSGDKGDMYTFNETTLLEFARLLKQMEDGCNIGTGKSAAV